MTTLLWQPLADAFLEVGVFVALMLALFGYLHYRHGRAVTGFLTRHAGAGPLVGALLGVVPGCGGAIVVMPLYLRGTVSFGTVVAALVATMGDASFVLIATHPQLALVVHGLLLGCGLVTGYAVDALGVAPRAEPAALASEPVHAGGSKGGTTALRLASAQMAPPSPGRRLALPSASVAAATLEPLPLAFWALWSLGMVLAVPVAMRVTDGPALAASLAGIDPYLLLGVAGTLVCAAVYLRRPALRDDSVESVAAQRRSVPDMLRHAARETSFVVTWVAVAYLATTWAIELTGLDLAALAGTAGFAGVAVGALVGLIPGCAPQVLLTGLYATGAVPLPTLLANAASQDGDALFPLLLLDRRGAAVAAAITTVPGLALGSGWLLLA